MPAIVVIGGQWGDEGKGRVIDLAASKAQVVARYSAGNNAGHTVVNELGEFSLHLVPAGIFYPDKTCVIGNGLVIDPGLLLEEIQGLEARGIRVQGRLFVSDRAHVTMPWHPIIDHLDEELRGKAAIGTTGRGVGPAFADKVGRLGIRLADLLDADGLRRRLELVVPYKNAVLSRLYGNSESLDVDDIHRQYVAYGESLTPYICDTATLVQDALAEGQTVLLEGAQGALLDLDLGTYEYVTSSVPSSLAGGACVGVGIGPTQITSVVGVYKSYITRVGNGPMPTELLGEDGSRLREHGPRPEYGATTGRPRRCGWFDGVASRYTARANALTAAVLTRLDVLDQFETIKVCTAYEIGGKVSDRFPADLSLLQSARPVYEELPGWGSDTSGVRRFEDLPPTARDYVHRIEQILCAPIRLVSVGPERDQAIPRGDFL